MREFENRVAVITGGASGIGLALAERLGQAGMRLVLADIETEALDAAVRQLTSAGLSAVGVRTDVTQWSDMQALAERTLKEFGAVHVLCNNAGVSVLGPTWELTIDDWRWVLGVNLWGVIHGIKAFVPAMRQRGQPGHVINVASAAAFFPLGTHAPYCASKAAVASISEALSSELRSEASPIGVSCLCPGMVSTNIHRSWRNRPPTDRRWSGVDMSPEARARADRIQGAGIPAGEVAQMTFTAIQDNRFWVITHEGIRPHYAERAQRFAEGMDPPGVVAADVFKDPQNQAAPKAG